MDTETNNPQPTDPPVNQPGGGTTTNSEDNAAAEPPAPLGGDITTRSDT